jgi:GTP-binding protein
VLSGIENVKIGDTICNREFPKPLKRITVEEPTVSMRFTINTSPLAGKEGKYVQSSKIKERLFKEALRNVAIRVEESEERDSFNVKGRGEFQLAILIETMRREGYEFCGGARGNT